MKNIVSLILMLSIAFVAHSQIVEFKHFEKLQKSKTPSTRFSSISTLLANSNNEQYIDTSITRYAIFDSGTIEYTTSGIVQGSARILKIFVGDTNVVTNRFVGVPLYLYVGAIQPINGNVNQLKSVASSLLNSLSGLINISTTLTFKNFISESYKHTNATLELNLGAKYINGIDTTTKKKFAFINGYSSFGISFQTRAWPAEHKTNVGLFYLKAYALFSYSNMSDLRKMYLNSIDNNFFWGYSIESGIAIKDYVNIKFGIYQYLNNNKISEMNEPLLKVSFDYTVFKK